MSGKDKSGGVKRKVDANKKVRLKGYKQAKQ